MSEAVGWKSEVETRVENVLGRELRAEEVRDVFRAGLGPEVRFASMCNAVAWAEAGKKGGASVPSFTERVKVGDYGIDAEWDVECPGGDGVPSLVVAGLLHHLL
jgi:hypothetical protein